MVVGALLTPSAWAVTLATPATPGLQTTGLLSESHVPAQATALSEIEIGAQGTWSVHPAVKWIVVKTLCPAELRAVALKFCVFPISREIVLLGLRVTDWTPPLGGLLVLFPTQPERAASETIAKIKRKPGQRRSMNPPRGRFPDASALCGGKL